MATSPDVQARPLLTIAETARRLGVSEKSVRRWITEGRLPAVRLGGQGAPLRIAEDELERWLFADPGEGP